MNRFIIFALIVGALGYLAYINKGKTQEPVGKVVYGEARYTFNFPQREIELVAIGQRYETADCMRDSVIQNVNEICVDNNMCVETKYQCKSDIDKRYKTMFEKGESSTHYVHLQHEDSKLKGVLLFWGLTDAESKSFCEAVEQRFAASRNNRFSVQCI